MKKSKCESCGEIALLTKHHTHVAHKPIQAVCWACHSDWNKKRCWGIIHVLSIVLLAVLFLPSGNSVKEASATSVFLTNSTQLNNDINAAASTSMFIYEDCNNNPNSYKKWKGFVLNNCIDCYEETIWGNSMNPTLSNGDRLIFDRKLNLSVGNIIEYNKTMEKTGVYYSWKKTDWIIHRIVGTQGEDLITLGDNNIVCEVIPKEAVIGVLVG